MTKMMIIAMACIHDVTGLRCLRSLLLRTSDVRKLVYLATFTFNLNILLVEIGKNLNISKQINFKLGSSKC